MVRLSSKYHYSLIANSRILEIYYTKIPILPNSTKWLTLPLTLLYSLWLPTNLPNRKSKEMKNICSVYLFFFLLILVFIYWFLSFKWLIRYLNLYLLIYPLITCWPKLWYVAILFDLPILPHSGPTWNPIQIKFL